MRWLFGWASRLLSRTTPRKDGIRDENRLVRMGTIADGNGNTVWCPHGMFRDILEKATDRREAIVAWVLHYTMNEDLREEVARAVARLSETDINFAATGRAKDERQILIPVSSELERRLHLSAETANMERMLATA